MLKRWKDYQDGVAQQLDCKRKHPGTSHIRRTPGSNKEAVMEHENLSASKSVRDRLSVTSAHHILAIDYKYQQNTKLTILALFEKTSLQV